MLLFVLLLLLLLLLLITGVDLSKIFGRQTKILGGKGGKK